jgi:regulator of CtrA degradation
MSTSTREIDGAIASAVTVSFAERFTQSDQFDVVFKDGMALVEKTANYLDGEGRKDAKALPSPLNMVYATESMRLTSRLLDLASWLLIRRGLRDGEMSVEEAARRRQRVKLKSFGRPSHIARFAELPEGLRGLIEASFALHDRIAQIDAGLNPQPSTPAAVAATAVNPVGDQMTKLRLAFSR